MGVINRVVIAGVASLIFLSIPPVDAAPHLYLAVPALCNGGADTFDWDNSIPWDEGQDFTIKDVGGKEADGKITKKSEDGKELHFWGIVPGSQIKWTIEIKYTGDGKGKITVIRQHGDAEPETESDNVDAEISQAGGSTTVTHKNSDGTIETWNFQKNGDKIQLTNTLGDDIQKVTHELEKKD